MSSERFVAKLTNHAA